MAGYTTWGPICLDCGHMHRTIEAAEECLRKHARACAQQGGYSDREIRLISSRRELTSYDVTRGPGRPVGK